MRISSITLRNFQCFGPEDTTVELDDFTCFIGANGTGKTALLRALCRMFGANQASRRLRSTDFHVPLGEKLETRDERNLVAEVRLEFPELVEGHAAEGTVPPSFENMVISEPGQTPYCRIRLEGTWTRTGVDTGDTEETLSWIRSSDPEPEGARYRVSPHDRARIRIHYVPASRDTAAQLANVSGTMLHELLTSVNWSDEVRGEVRDVIDQLREQVASVPAVERINAANRLNWRELYTDEIYNTPTLSFTGSDLDDVLKNAQIVFGPSHENADHDCARLSEGQQSLFYFAFINTIFTIGREVYTAYCSPPPEGDEAPITDHISCQRLNPAPLTLFAVEEPENHLGPHYLGRIMKQLGRIAVNDSAQVMLTSHSASIVSRVDPENLRYFRMEHALCVSHVRAITLPSHEPEAAKYVKEAVRAFPELYFSRLVVLCEGDSEEVLLPKFASVSGDELDLAFISVVPLGGRYVSHLWRLLSDLDIPYVTLLDLDRERKTGGWSTIKYVIKELLKLDSRPEFRDELLTSPEDGTLIEEEELERMHLRSDEEKEALHRWCAKLRGSEYGVFFSTPLDLDLMMLAAYPHAYQASVMDGDGPTGYENGHPTEERIEKAITAVLGKEGGNGSSYSDEDKELFPWYTYLFYGQGKPTTHTMAWLRIPESERSSRMPEPISALMDSIRSKLTGNTEQ